MVLTRIYFPCQASLHMAIHILFITQSRLFFNKLSKLFRKLADFVSLCHTNWWSLQTSAPLIQRQAVCRCSVSNQSAIVWVPFFGSANKNTDITCRGHRLIAFNIEYPSRADCSRFCADDLQKSTQAKRRAPVPWQRTNTHGPPIHRDTCRPGYIDRKGV